MNSLLVYRESILMLTNNVLHKPAVGNKPSSSYLKPEFMSRCIVII